MLCHPQQIASTKTNLLLYDKRTCLGRNKLNLWGCFWVWRSHGFEVTHREWAGEVRGPGDSCIALAPQREGPKGEGVCSGTDPPGSSEGGRTVVSLRWFSGTSTGLSSPVKYSWELCTERFGQSARLQESHPLLLLYFTWTMRSWFTSNWQKGTNIIGTPIMGFRDRGGQRPWGFHFLGLLVY